MLRPHASQGRDGPATRRHEDVQRRRHDGLLVADRVQGLVRDGGSVLAVVQVLTASRMWGKLQRVVPLSFPVAKRVHRWSGRLAILCTIPVFFHCVFILGFQTPDARVAIHSIAGTLVYGVFVAKMLVIRENKRARPASSGTRTGSLPVAGGALATTLLVAVADVEPLVLHERAVRLLMDRRLWRPVTALVCVAGAVFAVAQGQLLAPAAPAAHRGNDRARQRGQRQGRLRRDMRRLPRRGRGRRRRRPEARRRRLCGCRRPGEDRQRRRA